MKKSRLAFFLLLLPSISFAQADYFSYVITKNYPTIVTSSSLQAGGFATNSSASYLVFAGTLNNNTPANPVMAQGFGASTTDFIPPYSVGSIYNQLGFLSVINPLYGNNPVAVGFGSSTPQYSSFYPRNIEFDATDNLIYNFEASGFTSVPINVNPLPTTPVYFNSQANSSGITKLQLTSGGYYQYLFTLMFMPTTGSTINITDFKPDTNGDIVVVGNFNGSVDIDPLGAFAHVISSTSPSAFIALYSGWSGQLLWSQIISGSSMATAKSVTINTANNNIGALILLDVPSAGLIFPGFPTPLVGHAPAQDLLLLELDSFGNYLRAGVVGGISSQFNYGNILYNPFYQNYFLVGSFTGSIDVDPSVGVTNYSVPPFSISSDGFIAQYSPTPTSPTFTLLTSSVIGSTQTNFSLVDLVSADVGQCGNILVLGQWVGHLPQLGTSSARGLFVSKYDFSLNSLWTRSYDSPNIYFSPKKIRSVNGLFWGVTGDFSSVFGNTSQFAMFYHQGIDSCP